MSENPNGERIVAEDLGGGVVICRSREHTFGTDAFLLADFSLPKKGELACDLGTGCGIIPLLWAKNGAPREVWGLDIQKEAVEQFQRSVSLSSLGCKVYPVVGDLRDLPDVLPAGQFGLVSCNPPYQAEGTGILSGTPEGRTARHETLCRLDDVCASAERLLRFGGRFCICMRPERLADTICSLREHHIEPKRLRFVSRAAGDIPWLFLLEGRKGSKPFLKLEPPLALYQNGEMTPEFKQIYR